MSDLEVQPSEVLYYWASRKSVPPTLEKVRHPQATSQTKVLSMYISYQERKEETSMD